MKKGIKVLLIVLWIVILATDITFFNIVKKIKSDNSFKKETIEQYENIVSKIEKYETLINDDLNVLEDNQMLVDKKKTLEETKKQLETEVENITDELEKIQ